MTAPIDQGEPHKAPNGKLSREDQAQIARYLESPVQTGIWKFDALWLEHSGISRRIWDELEPKLIPDQIIAYEDNSRPRRIRVSQELKDSLQEAVFSRISFILNLFVRMRTTIDIANMEEMTEETKNPRYRMIIALINLDALRMEYAESLAIFNNEVFTPSFSLSMQRDTLFYLKSGVVMLHRPPRDKINIEIISWQLAPLVSLKAFLCSIGKVAEPTLLPVYSPEEEVFAPFFSLFELAVDYVIPQSHLRPFLIKAITNYGEGNFQDSVAAIGLASEDVLTQIFESLYREQMTKGLTLGQLSDEINKRAASIVGKKEDAAPDLSVLFTEINKTIQNADITAKLAAEQLRKVVASIIEANKYMLSKIDRLGKVEKKISVYPDHVAHAVNELIRYRNAAAHKTRVPIGPVECTRSAHSFIVLYSWWRRERIALDWSKPAHDVVKEVLVKNGH